jgi:hypothetical protein
MVGNSILTLLNWLIFYLIGKLPDVPIYSDLSNAVAAGSHYLAMINVFVPLETIFAIFIAWIVLEFTAILGLKILLWIGHLF